MGAGTGSAPAGTDSLADTDQVEMTHFTNRGAHPHQEPPSNSRVPVPSAAPSHSRQQLQNSQLEPREGASQSQHQPQSQQSQGHWQQAQSGPAPLPLQTHAAANFRSLPLPPIEGRPRQSEAPPTRPHDAANYASNQAQSYSSYTNGQAAQPYDTFDNHAAQQNNSYTRIERSGNPALQLRPRIRECGAGANDPVQCRRISTNQRQR